MAQADFRPDELEEFKEAFALFDDTGSGSIEVSAFPSTRLQSSSSPASTRRPHVLTNSARLQSAKLGTVLRSLGFTPTEADVEDMQSKAGASVDFDALLGFITAAKAKTIKEQDVTEALKVFDKDGNGYIKTDEVKRILSQLGEKLSAREVEAILAEADPRRSGQVPYDFFVCVARCPCPTPPSRPASRPLDVCAHVSLANCCVAS